MHKQKGFSSIEFILALLTIGLLAGIGWVIWHKTNKPEVKSLPSSTNSEVNCSTGFKLATQENMNIRFCYPTDWSYNYNYDSYTKTKFIELKSKDYTKVDGGYGGTASGSLVVISSYDAGKPSSSVKEVFDQNKAEAKSSEFADKSPLYSDKKATKVAGKEGVSYLSAPYEGSVTRVNTFDNQNISYSISIEQDVMKGDDKNPLYFNNLDQYQKLVDSIQLIH